MRTAAARADATAGGRFDPAPHNRAMSRASYGKTWWGEQWLQALAHIDFDNRLPRGRSYANKGAVRDLVVAVGRVEARVQGSRPQPYAVTVSVPPLPAKDSARLLSRLAADPTLIARLLNRELDPAVLEAARSLDISVFPGRFRPYPSTSSHPSSRTAILVNS